MNNFEKEVAFIFPVMVDSDDRLYNMKCVIKYLREIFKNPTIIISEQKNSGLDFSDICDFHLIYNTNFDIIHKCKIINDAVKFFNSPYFIVNDCDCTVSGSSYMYAYHKLKLGYDLIVCHNNSRLEITTDLRDNLNRHWDFTKTYGMKFFPVTLEIGGAVAYNRKTFLNNGMYNENFIGWGCEDDEIICRFEKFNSNVVRKLEFTDYLIHIDHPDSIGKRDFNTDQYKYNYNELIKIRNIDNDELSNYIRTWTWAHE